MTPANTIPEGRKYPVLAVAVLAVCALVGAAYYTRGPDLTFAPEMAEAPVILADGSVIEVQKYEVTVAEWNTCHAAGACALALRATASHAVS